MSVPFPKDPLLSLSQLALFDIAVAVADDEAQLWGDDGGLSLFLGETVDLVRREAQSMALLCASRTGERARVFCLAGAWSEVLADAPHLAALAQKADVWVFGVPDANLTIPGVVPVAIPQGAPLCLERGIVIEAQSFGACFLTREGGSLDPDNPRETRYFEGFLSVRADATEIAAGRLAAVLKLPPLAHRWGDHELLGSWIARFNRVLVDALEAQRLRSRAQDEELARVKIELELQRDEAEKLENMVRGYVGGQTWREVQLAIRGGKDDVANLDREELTICFCDLVGFTKLSERLSPRDIASLLNDHFARLANIVRVHGGTIDKFIGDAMLAYFPEPVEAFFAAKKMVQESRTVRVEGDFTLPIQVRVGLNTGKVALANLGVAEYRQRTVLGDAVNFAQRMQSSAPPQAVMMSEHTMRLLPPVMIRSLEPVRVAIKGRSAQVEAYVWTQSSDRRDEVSDRLSIRSSLLTGNARTSLADRLRGKG
jgi:class 3 adenylate cyclase